MPDEASPRDFGSAKLARAKSGLGLYALMHGALTGRIRYRALPGRPVVYHLDDAAKVGAEKSDTAA